MLGDTTIKHVANYRTDPNIRRTYLLVHPVGVPESFDLLYMLHFTK